MPDFKTFSLPKICGLFDEAMRTIPGYDKYNPDVEPKALIDYGKTKDNYTLYLNDCMRHKKDERDKSKKIRQLIKEKTGKTPKSDAVACSVIITMPTTYEGDPRLFFEAAAKAMMIAAGIKEDDVLYAAVHMDESQPHMHFAFLPTSYVRNYEKHKDDYIKSCAVAKMNGKKAPSRPAILKGELNRKIGEDEKPVGINCGRFGKAFLHTLNRVLEQRMAEMGVECQIGNGKGSQFKVDKMLKKQREESVAQARRADAEAKRADEEKARADALKAQNEAMQAEFEEKESELKARLRVSLNEVAKAKRERDDAEAEIEYMQIEQQSLRESIKALTKSVKELTESVITFVPRLVRELMNEWKSFKLKAERESFEADLEAKALGKVKADKTIQGIYTPFKEAAEVAKAMLEKEVINGVDISIFEARDVNGDTTQKTNYAIKQIRKVAKEDGREDEFENDSEALKIAIEDWFNRAKYEPLIKKQSEKENAEFKKSSARAERAYEVALNHLKGLDDDFDR